MEDGGMKWFTEGNKSNETSMERIEEKRQKDERCLGSGVCINARKSVKGGPD